MLDDVSIDVLNLTVRPYSALIANGIDTVKKLLDTDNNELYRIENIGKRSLAEINDALRLYIKQKDENCSHNIKDAIESSLNQITNVLNSYMVNNIKQLKGELLSAVNELRTIVLEQSRILERYQSMGKPDAIINKISEKIPGFNATVHELYKNLFNDK